MSQSARFVIAYTEYCSGHIVVCKGNALGEVVAKFPRSADGDAAAHIVLGVAEAMRGGK
jgi:hypothetical protein